MKFSSDFRVHILTEAMEFSNLFQEKPRVRLVRILVSTLKSFILLIKWCTYPGVCHISYLHHFITLYKVKNSPFIILNKNSYNNKRK